MKVRNALAILAIGWLLGIGAALAGVAVTGGWYEYRLVGDDAIVRMINEQGWHPVPGRPPNYLRRPRIRLP